MCQMASAPMLSGGGGVSSGDNGRRRQAIGQCRLFLSCLHRSPDATRVVYARQARGVSVRVRVGVSVRVSLRVSRQAR